MSRNAASPPPIVFGCAPEDAPAMRSVVQRLRVDGFTAWLAADELGAQADQPRALREAVRGAGAVVVGLSRRSWGSDGQLVPALARLADVLTLTPGRRTLIALKLARCDTPPELAEAQVIELFAYSGYERLSGLLRERAARERAVAPAASRQPPAPPPTPVLALRGRFALPILERQGQLARLGRGVARMAYLLDARRALVIGGGGATLLDLRDNTPIWTIDCPVRRAALSSGGRLLALAAGHTIQLWDLRDGRLAATCEGHSGLVGGLAFTPDERTLISVGHDGSLRLWRAGGEGGPPGASLATLPAHSDQVTSVAVSPDGALIASGSADRTVRIWRTLDRAAARTLSGHGGAVEALAFSPDGSTLAAGSRGRSVRLWDTRTWQPRLTLEGHDGAVEALAFSPDGSLLASGAADHTARIWRVGGGLERTLSGHSGPITGLSFGPGGAQLASLGEDDRLLIWGMEDGAQLDALRPLSGRVSALAFSDDGSLLAVGASDGSTAVYHPANDAPPQIRYSDHQGAVTGLAFAPGRRLISTAADRTVRECRLDGGTGAILLQTHGALQVTALAPGGRLLASSDGETTVQLWRLSGEGEHAGGQFWRVLRGMRSRVRLVAFAPGGAAVAVAGDDGTVLLWRTADLERERDEPALRLPSLVGRPRALAFSRDGAQLAAGGDQGGAQIWRVADGAAVRLSGQGAPLCGLAFSLDGLSLAAGDTHGQVAIWRLSAEERRRRGAKPATTIVGHAGAVEHIAFSPAGGVLATGSADGTVRLWRV